MPQWMAEGDVDIYVGCELFVTVVLSLRQLVAVDDTTSPDTLLCCILRRTQVPSPTVVQPFFIESCRRQLR
jgi:hypothetical protein